MSQQKEPRWAPRSTVAAIVEREGRFLMVEELIQGRPTFNQPAGHLERNERFVDAVCRETLEETGWIVAPQALLGLYVYLTEDRSLTFHRVCFIAQAIEHQVDALLDAGIIQTHWLTRDEIAERAEQLRSPLVLKCVDDYLSGVRFPLEVIQDQVFTTDHE